MAVFSFNISRNINDSFSFSRNISFNSNINNSFNRKLEEMGEIN